MLRAIPKLSEQMSSRLPCPRVYAILDEQGVNDLTVNPRDEGKLGLVLPVRLRFFKHPWLEVGLQGFGGCSLAVEWILT